LADTSFSACGVALVSLRAKRSVDHLDAGLLGLPVKSLSQSSP
jgi:hypothetical protein